VTVSSRRTYEWRVARHRNTPAGTVGRCRRHAWSSPLILVTTGTGRDLVVLEGHVRLTALMLARNQLPPQLEVLVGTSPTMTRSDCW